MYFVFFALGLSHEILIDALNGSDEDEEDSLPGFPRKYRRRVFPRRGRGYFYPLKRRRFYPASLRKPRPPSTTESTTPPSPKPFWKFDEK